MIPVPGDKVSIFELEIMTSTSKIRLVENGLKLIVQPIQDKNEWGNYTTYQNEEVIIDTSLMNQLEFMVQNIVDSFSGKKIKCTIDNAIDAHSVMESM